VGPDEREACEAAKRCFSTVGVTLAAVVFLVRI